VHKRDLGLVVMLTSVTVAIVLTVAVCYGLIVYRQLTAAFVTGIATPSVSVGVLVLGLSCPRRGVLQGNSLNNRIRNTQGWRLRALQPFSLSLTGDREKG
jgi:hypothetical protein